MQNKTKNTTLTDAAAAINEALVTISQAIVDEPEKEGREALYAALDKAYDALEILDAAADRQRERPAERLGNLLEASLRGFARPSLIP